MASRRADLISLLADRTWGNTFSLGKEPGETSSPGPPSCVVPPAKFLTCDWFVPISDLPLAPLLQCPGPPALAAQCHAPGWGTGVAQPRIHCTLDFTISSVGYSLPDGRQPHSQVREAGGRRGRAADGEVSASASAGWRPSTVPAGRVRTVLAGGLERGQHMQNLWENGTCFVGSPPGGRARWLRGDADPSATGVPGLPRPLQVPLPSG